MRTYEQKRADRIARLQERAESKRTEASTIIAGARSRAAMIPLGQPILIGHHSEGRDRRYRARISRDFDRGFTAINEAEDLQRRADAAASNTAISSDDPEACAKIGQRIAELEQSQEEMKAINKGWRKGGVEALRKLGYSSERVAQIETAMKQPFARDQPFPAYSLQNNTANIRRLKQRLEEQKRRTEKAALDAIEETIGEVVLTQDHADNRVRLQFPGKPAPATIAELKRSGFRWAPSVGAWQRQLTNGAVYAARQLLARVAEPRA